MSVRRRWQVLGVAWMRWIETSRAHSFDNGLNTTLRFRFKFESIINIDIYIYPALPTRL